jgi:haloalkane dehalogenase
MGQSGKPDIQYTTAEHIKYFSGWLASLNLEEKPILVMHGWGSVIGCEYARLNQDAIAGLVFYESHLRAARNWSMLSLPVQQWSSELLKHHSLSKIAVLNDNVLVNDLFPAGSLHSFTPEELAVYQKPFKTPSDRKVLWQYLQDLPLGASSEGVSDLIDAYSQWLQTSNIPKLLCFAVPGFITTIETVAWAKDNMPNLEISDIGEALHFAQESSPQALSDSISGWIQHLPVLVAGD